MYKCKYFGPYELVDRETFRKYGHTSYRYFDRTLLRLADRLREEFGRCIINDWYWNNDNYNDASVFKWSGLRIPDSPFYREYSMHSHGKALDLKFQDTDADTVRQWIKDNFDTLKKELGLFSITLEEGVSWVHIQIDNKEEGVHTFHK
jgi:hypothetical protein